MADLHSAINGNLTVSKRSSVATARARRRQNMKRRSTFAWATGKRNELLRKVDDEEDEKHPELQRGEAEMKIASGDTVRGAPGARAAAGIAGRANPPGRRPLPPPRRRAALALPAPHRIPHVARRERHVA